MNDLVQDLEKVKILFISSYEDLLKRGKITETQFEGILEILDGLDSLDRDELVERVKKII